MSEKIKKRSAPLVLVILDGFGVSADEKTSPVAHASLPTFNFIEHNFPFTTIQASGVAVGLPWWEAGNSEVGHLTIGAGKTLYHHLPRIITSIYDGTFFSNDAFKKAAQHVRDHNSSLHIAGLISSGSVHSYIDHLYALLEFSKKEGIERVFIHGFSDGKDAPPIEAAKFFAGLEERIGKEWPHAKISTILGRFYALDRDQQWDRVEVAYNLLTQGVGQKITSISKYLQQSYDEKTTDEFIKPAVLAENEIPMGLVQDNDALIFSDYREDSMRELTHAFVDENFENFSRKKISNLLVVTMTEYQKDLNAIPAFGSLDNEWCLSRILSDSGFKHLHIAETQKYAHVTYFLNGGREQPFVNEERILVPSYATAHFDDIPQMRAPEITEKIVENLTRYDVIIANYANADMVGHSGNFEAASRAVEFLDTAVATLMEKVLALDGTLLITADHGNVELKRDTISGEKLTEHSTNPVPFYCIDSLYRLKNPRTDESVLKQKKEISGILTDVAPTIIEILGLEKPKEMTGKSLLPSFTAQT